MPATRNTQETRKQQDDSASSRGPKWNRSLPVPGTGRRRGGNAYRHMRTWSERREGCFVDFEAGERPPRSARSPSSLPTVWDDVVRSDYRNRSWKHYRKQQWKNIK